MKAFIFPGQGSQFKGMGSDLYKSDYKAKKLFQLANQTLNFDICKIMFDGSIEELKQTNITQPAIFIHSTILAKCINNFEPDMVAGHSLGEFSALAAIKTITFEEGLQLVVARANAMHKACQKNNSTMAAIIGIDSKTIINVCAQIPDIVVPANYNSPGQIVISGDNNAIEKACKKLTEIGAKRAIKIPVAGAFHSPIMESAKNSLKEAINKIEFQNPCCPIYQNVCAKPIVQANTIKNNLIEQLTAPVQWYQTIQNMILNGAKIFHEVGPGNVLTGLNKRIDRSVESIKLTI